MSITSACEPKKSGSMVARRAQAIQGRTPAAQPDAERKVSKTVAIPDHAGTSRAAHSDWPKVSSDSAVIQYSSGGFSKYLT